MKTNVKSKEANKTLLFSPTSVSPYSAVFYLSGQKTIVGLGFEDDESEVTFRIVDMDAAGPQCPCPPRVVNLPEVNASAPLTCCGEPIVVNINNPYVILDAPQGIAIQAVYTTPAGGKITAKVWALDTNTRDVTERMRGCPCQE